MIMWLLRRLFGKKLRVTGISTPIGGTSWEYGVSERECAEKLLTFLENRRVLYSPLSHKCPKGVVESVSKIRAEVQGLMETIPRESVLFGLVQEIRDATLKFLQYACSNCEDPTSCSDCTIYETGCVKGLARYQSKVKSQVRKICKEFDLIVDTQLG